MKPRLRVVAAVGASVLTHALVAGAIVSTAHFGDGEALGAGEPVKRMQRIMRVALNGSAEPGAAREDNGRGGDESRGKAELRRGSGSQGPGAKGGERRTELSAREQGEVPRKATTATASTPATATTTTAATTTAATTTAATTTAATTTAATTTAATTTAATTTAATTTAATTTSTGSTLTAADGFAGAGVEGSAGTSSEAGSAESESGADLNALHARIQQSAERCYASTAARFRLKGNVTLELCVDAQGHASRVLRRGSAGSPVLDRAAEVCVVPGAEPLPVTAGCYSIPVHFRPAT